jgi:Cu-processing system ATP-binding protein
MIKINGLKKSYGKLEVLKHVDLDLQQGTVYAIVGPNAAGKTTLIKSLLGLTKADEGSIEINNQMVNGDCSYRNNIGYMPQLAKFPENLTVKEILRLVRDLRNNPEQTDDELISAFKLEKEMHKPVKNLSGGTRQKLSAVIGFLFKPAILILDEPTAGLDPVSSSTLKDKIIAEKKNNKMIIITSHIMSEIEELCDYIIFLLDGSVYFQGTKAMVHKHTQQVNLERAIAILMESKQE